MRKGILFVGLTGLCACVLMGLIAWAGEKPVPEAPPAQTEPAVTPGISRYSRHRESAFADEEHLAGNPAASPAEPPLAPGRDEFSALPSLSETGEPAIPPGDPLAAAPATGGSISVVDIAPPSAEPAPTATDPPLFPPARRSPPAVA